MPDLDSETDESIAVTILRKMLSHRYIGGSHTASENVPKGFPPRLHKRVVAVLKQLVKEGCIIEKPTNYGPQVSINPNMIREIAARIADYDN